ncbi:MAG TPA: metal ABC transporter permease [Solirubrobacteraceae bacterium]|jgi:ABC-type Mn2+/Zn2+ transport system permease subunit|nr:metal ABC transporter permease [Solirubrobacteraceae bacterium]
MLHALGHPWADPTMRRALAEVALLGITGGALGSWIVLYGLSYSAESMAHALFPGLVAAALLGAPLLLGGAVGVVVAALAIALVGRTPEVGRDTAIAVVVTTLFGLGVVLALSPASPPGIQGLLFGDILGVSDGDLRLAGVLAVVVVVGLRLLHGQLLTVGFDRAAAPAFGGRAGLVEAALLVLVAVAIVVAVQGLGNLLVVALLVAPAATARLFARRVVPMMALACAVAIGAGVGGLYLSYYAGTAAGASIAGVMVAVFVVALGITRDRPRPWRAAPPPAAP